MPDYIERDAVIAIIEEQRKAICPYGRYGLGYSSDRDTFDATQGMIDQVNGIPSADVAPVVHGRWIPVDGGKYKCSCCHTVRKTDVAKDHYCPNCGAMIDGGVNDA